MKTTRFLLLALIFGFLTIACQPAIQSSPTPEEDAFFTPTVVAFPKTAQSSPPPEEEATPAIPTDIWIALLEHTPVPWTTPLPPLEPTILDATYVKINPRPATPFPCKRCPDYALEGGLWKLSLSKGVFRIYYTMNGWRSLGSYTVSGDQIYLFNDPYCNWDTGLYKWKLEEGALILTEIHDPCSQGLRAANLTDQSWLSCDPPNLEAKVTDHWQKPTGCDLDP